MLFVKEAFNRCCTALLVGLFLGAGKNTKSKPLVSRMEENGQIYKTSDSLTFNSLNGKI